MDIDKETIKKETSVELDSLSDIDLFMHHFMTDNGKVHEPEIAASYEEYWAEEEGSESDEWLYLAEYLASSLSDTEKEDFESDDSFILLPKLRGRSGGDSSVFMYDSLE